MPEYITIEGMQRLQRRVNHLIEERPDVIQQVVTARELGDLSENAEYHAARERQRNMDNEMTWLRDRMASLKVIDPVTIPKDAVRFGAFIKLKEKDIPEIQIYQLVGVDEIYDREDGIMLVSVASPMGKSLIGKKLNDSVVVNAPKGDRFFKILDIY